MKNLLSFLLLLSISSTLIASVSLQSEGGWLESCYVTWTPVDGATGYEVYYKEAETDNYQKLDASLVREYETYGRADVVGISAGNYQMKVVPIGIESAMKTESVESGILEVKPYDRSGFAHYKTASSTFNPTNGVGAYRNDGTLKTGAKVLYVHAGNAKTIESEVITDSKGNKTKAVGLQKIISLYEKGYDKTPLAIRIIGTIHATDMDYFGSSAEGMQIKGHSAYSEMNITIEGIGQDATIHGFGIFMRNAASVEIRNLAIMWCMDDAVSMDTDNSNLWIHNLDLFYGQRGSDADQAKGDGTLDLKGNTRYTTISYCHLWDNGKASLCGMKSESGPNYITYHHNWFDHSDSRHPRVRTMSVHVYNNYFDGNAKYGVGAAMSSDIFVENNYFRNCKYPMLISKQGSDIHNGIGSSDETKGTFSGEDGGIIKACGNYMIGQISFEPYIENDVMFSRHFDAYVVDDRTKQIPSSVSALQGGHQYNNFDTDATKMYQEYICHQASEVPDIVCGSYGAGRCQHGDFSWTFDDSEDTNYDVISELSTAINNYRSKMIGFYSSNNDDTDDSEDSDDKDNPVQPQVPIAGSVYCHFLDKTPSSTMVNVNGTYSNSHSILTYQGTTYTICVKMESATEILLKPTSDCTITLLFGGDVNPAGKRIKIDGATQYVTENGQYRFNAEGGKTYTLKKGDTLYLFLIIFEPISSSIASCSSDYGTKTSIIYDLYGHPVSSPIRGRIYILDGKKVTF